ncbi:hypothetical protein LTR17_023226 [Elasticomyces elasticus]|nr:hypothetical protein LTR17_023226 [Elasticomyces elasticus]
MGLTMHSFDSGYAPQRPMRHCFMMYTARAQQAFQYQQFYFEAKTKLGDMLIIVGQEAKAASFPACMDYPEIIEAITQLLQEAQLMSTLTFAQIEQAGVETAPFAEKVGVVESVLANVRMRSVAATKPVARKRARRDEEEDVEMSFSSYNVCNKRNRFSASEHNLAVQPSNCGGYADYLQTSHWAQAICD